MEEDGGDVFEGGKNRRSPQHPQNLEHCKNSYKSLPYLGRHISTHNTLHSNDSLYSKRKFQNLATCSKGQLELLYLIKYI